METDKVGGIKYGSSQVFESSFNQKDLTESFSFRITVPLSDLQRTCMGVKYCNLSQQKKKVLKFKHKKIKISNKYDI